MALINSEMKNVLSPNCLELAEIGISHFDWQRVYLYIL